MEFIDRIKRLFRVISTRYRTRQYKEIFYQQYFRLGTGALFVTLSVLAAAISLYLFLLLSSSGNYLSTWFFLTFSAILVLISLSAPHYIEITEKELNLHGYVDMTTIPLDQISGIYPINKKEYGRLIPFLANIGFLGFHGYFINKKRAEIVKVYATKYQNLVDIRTVNDLNYIINVENPEEFIEMFEKIKLGTK